MSSFERVYVVGHTGMVGDALVRRLLHYGFEATITATRQEVDLCDADKHIWSA